MSIPNTEEQERAHLAHVISLLEAELARADASIAKAAGDVQQHKELIWKNQRDMDHAEKANIRVMVDTSIVIGEHAVQQRRRLAKLATSPYFGRVVFREDGGNEAAHYIGVHGFADPYSKHALVHDWRAPVSTLYYDFESGDARFHSPEGMKTGQIAGKRQYKISAGQLEYHFDSALNIGDDILRRELGKSADSKMRNIVSTIQREQNAIIRDETSDILLLQGVAGSGKTSIALHRVAFLLYRFKDTLASSNVMILSPNRVFSDYISRVLPELGEEQIAETDFDALARRYLPRTVRYQTFAEQVAQLLDGADDETTRRIRYKATPAFVEELNDWIDACTAEFAPHAIEHAHESVPAEWVAQAFAAVPGTPVFARLERVAEGAIQQLKQKAQLRNGRWSAADTKAIRTQVAAMFPYKDAAAIYRAFYNAPGRAGMLRPLPRGQWEHADVFPLIYTHLRTGRHDGYGHIRHLLVDEMQDYTPIQYAVLRHLFSCKMTILGDANQSVNPFSSSSLETIHRIFPEATCLELNKSYRSTSEITRFAQHISRNDKLVPIERHGPEPRIHATSNTDDEVEAIRAEIHAFHASEHQSLGIVCKTAPQAKALHAALLTAGVHAALLDYDSTTFTEGVVITSAHIAKGLEFDRVIVPHADATTYANDIDRSMLYIACTRAMHELALTYASARSPFLTFA